MHLKNGACDRLQEEHEAERKEEEIPEYSHVLPTPALHSFQDRDAGQQGREKDEKDIVGQSGQEPRQERLQPRVVTEEGLEDREIPSQTLQGGQGSDEADRSRPEEQEKEKETPGDCDSDTPQDPRDPEGGPEDVSRFRTPSRVQDMWFPLQRYTQGGIHREMGTKGHEADILGQARDQFQFTTDVEFESMDADSELRRVVQETTAAATEAEPTVPEGCDPVWSDCGRITIQTVELGFQLREVIPSLLQERTELADVLHQDRGRDRFREDVLEVFCESGIVPVPMVRTGR